MAGRSRNISADVPKSKNTFILILGNDCVVVIVLPLKKPKKTKKGKLPEEQITDSCGSRELVLLELRLEGCLIPNGPIP